MNESDLVARLATAEALAREAGRRALAARRSGLSVALKSDQSVVTEVDATTEAFVRDGLTTAYPEDGFLGEEGGGAKGVARPTWIVDPIDGTANFAAGRAFWCVSIGFYVGGAPALGVIYDPEHDEMFHGLASAPPRLNGVVTPPLARRTLGPGAALGFVLSRSGDAAATFRVLEETRARGASVRALGASALMLAYVALGRLDGHFEETIKLWDAAAGLALLAGAKLSYRAAFDLSRPMEPASVIAGAPGVYEELCAMCEAIEGSPTRGRG